MTNPFPTFVTSAPGVAVEVVLIAAATWAEGIELGVPLRRVIAAEQPPSG